MAVLVALGLAVSVWGAVSWRMIDLDVYRRGAWALLHGFDPYDPALVRSPRLPYTYTPFSTVFFVPIELLPRWLARAAMVGLSLGLLHLAVRLVVPRGTSPGRAALVGLVTVVVALSEPVRQTLWFGQINLVLLALVLVDLLVLRRTRASGVLIGIAAGVKLIPLVYVLYLVVTRRFAAAARAAGAAAATVVVGAVVLPRASLDYFFDGGLSSEHVGSASFVGNQSLDGVLSRLAGGVDAAHTAWVVVAGATLALGMWTAARARTRHGEIAGIAVAALTGLLVSPISWTHHWVWWMVPAVLLAERARCERTPSSIALVVVAIAPFFASPMWWIPTRDGEEFHHAWWQALLADTYAIVGVVALVATAVVVGRAPLRRRDERVAALA